MRSLLLSCLLAVPTLAFAQDGWETIFDGKTLKGWDGDPKFWSVEDGTLTGATTADNPTDGNTFIIWTGGEPGDFELKFQYKIVAGNSGVQYRSFKLPKAKDQWRLGGYQADIDSGDTYSGILYGEAFRGILANRGLITTLNEEGKPTTVGTLGDSSAIQAKIKKEDWNDYHVIAKDYHFTHIINGVHTAECTDEDTDVRRKDGLLGLQLHAGPPMKIQFRDIKIKQVAAKTTSSQGKTPESVAKKGPAPSDDINQFVLQVTANGGYVLKTKALTESALTEILKGLAEMNPEAKIRIQPAKGASKDLVKQARAAAKEAGVSVQAGKKKRKGN
ncbi:MAG: biopolymer transport protein ExbD [Verrucomicrobiales bacterium]|jgi:biopolymer transport protein ExbD